MAVSRGGGGGGGGLLSTFPHQNLFEPAPITALAYCACACMHALWQLFHVGVRAYVITSRPLPRGCLVPSQLGCSSLVVFKDAHTHNIKEDKMANMLTMYDRFVSPSRRPDYLPPYIHTRNLLSSLLSVLLQQQCQGQPPLFQESASKADAL